MEPDQDSRADAGWEVAATAIFESFQGSVNIPLSWDCGVGLGKDIILVIGLGESKPQPKFRSGSLDLEGPSFCSRESLQIPGWKLW